MRGVFDEEEAEPASAAGDKELTLTSTALVGIALGLVVVCGLCFGLGYAAGHRGSDAPPASTQAGAGTPTSLQADASRSKPSAVAQVPVAPAAVAPGQAPQAAVDDTAATSDPDANPIANPISNPPANAQAPARQTGGPQPTQVRPALPNPAYSGQPNSVRPTYGQPAYGQQAQPGVGPGGARGAQATQQPGMAPAGMLMVQIAAVTYPEDAVVLVNALRRRGYTVYVRREASDGLIHVRIGPFTSRDVANQWRQKLVNDGYNAIVQP